MQRNKKMSSKGKKDRGTKVQETEGSKEAHPAGVSYPRLCDTLLQFFISTASHRRILEKELDQNQGSAIQCQCDLYHKTS